MCWDLAKDLTQIPSRGREISQEEEEGYYQPLLNAQRHPSQQHIRDESHGCQERRGSSHSGFLTASLSLGIHCAPASPRFPPAHPDTVHTSHSALLRPAPVHVSDYPLQLNTTAPPRTMSHHLPSYTGKLVSFLRYLQNNTVDLGHCSFWTGTSLISGMTRTKKQALWTTQAVLRVQVSLLANNSECCQKHWLGL